MNRYYNGYSYVVEINYGSIKERYEFVTEEEALDFFNTLDSNKLKRATIKQNLSF